MLSREEFPLIGATPADGAGAETLDLLTGALGLYLEELQEYRYICLRHSHTAAAYITPNALHLAKLFPWRDETLAFVRQTAERLPPWSKSYLWSTDRQRWRGLQNKTRKRQALDARGCLLLTRGVAWEGRPVLICASSPEGHGCLRVELLLPPVHPGLPELPLRAVASGLLCHEHLLPERLASPLPPVTKPRSRSLPLREFLRRAMPSNLYASQCFSLGGAEN